LPAGNFSIFFLHLTSPSPLYLSPSLLLLPRGGLKALREKGIPPLLPFILTSLFLSISWAREVKTVSQSHTAQQKLIKVLLPHPFQVPSFLVENLSTLLK
jgi:hypothetical protein